MTNVTTLGKEKSKGHIVFEKVLNSDYELTTPEISPQSWRNVTLLAKGYAKGYDLMFAKVL